MKQKFFIVLFLLIFCLSLVFSGPVFAAGETPETVDNVSRTSDQSVVIKQLILRHTPESPLAQSLALLDRAAGLPAGAGLTSIGTDATALANARRDVENRIHALAGVSLTYLRPMSGGAHVFVLDSSVDAKTAVEISAKIGQSSDVVYAEPDWPMQATLIPNDPDWTTHQWDLNPSADGANATYSSDMPTAWDYTTGDANIRIAVLDTGLLKGHPQISSRYVGGYDFIADPFVANDSDGRDADASDPGDWVVLADNCGSAKNSSWHGTHVAGTIAASSNDSDTVVGINWQSKIVPVRVLGKCGGYTSDIADGIRWAAGLTVDGVPDNTYPAKVLNLSLGGTGACSTTYQTAIDDANAAGAIIVVSAGNNNEDASTFQPANCTGVITVGASEVEGYRSSYSNYGSGVTLSAQGGDVYPAYLGGAYNSSNWRWIWSLGSTATTIPNGTYSTRRMVGTSQAAPHVAGVVSLMLTLKPALTYTQIVNILKTTATPYHSASTCASTVTCSQSGILHAGRALTATTKVIALDGSVGTSEWADGVLGTVNATQFGATWDDDYWYFSVKGGFIPSDYFMIGIDVDPNNYTSNTGGTADRCGASFPTENKPDYILIQHQNTYTRESWGWNGSAWNQSVWNPSETGEYDFSGAGGDYEVKLKKSSVFSTNEDTSPVAFYLWLSKDSCEYLNAWPPENHNGWTSGTPIRLLFAHTFFKTSDSGRVPATYNTRKGWDTQTLSAGSTAYNFFGQDDSVSNPWLRMTTTSSGAGGASCTVRAHLAGNRAFSSDTFAGINRYIDFDLTDCTNLNVDVQMRYEQNEVVAIDENTTRFYHCALSSCTTSDWTAVSAGSYTRDVTNHNLLLTNVPQTQFSYWMIASSDGPTAVTFNALAAHSNAAPVVPWIGLLLAGALVVWLKRSR
jgi:serine protease